MATIRWLLGRLILLIDFLTSPRGVQRTDEEQAQLDLATAGLTLYQYAACPFCVKVRRATKRHSLKIALRDAKKTPEYGEELLQQGGKLKVPCLKIEEGSDVQWLYESSDIIDYLEQRFINASTVTG